MHSSVSKRLSMFGSAAIAAFALATPLVAHAAEDTGSAAPSFKEGDVISLDKVESLKPFLPAEFWNNRDFFFYEGMKLEIGPFYRDYSVAPEYLAVTEKFKGQAKIGADDSLENFTAGQPFPMDGINCKGDPQAGIKIIWNFDYQWEGDGSQTKYFYSYWDRGEQLPLYYQGTSKTILLSHRIEKEYLDDADLKGDMFRGEKRKMAFGIEVEAPFDARGIALMTYRYKSSDSVRDQAKNDDTWVYVPTLRRVRRISSAQRTDSVAGTDFTFDDLRGFAGIVPQYTWQCLGEMDMIAPVNSKVKAYPYSQDHNFGPYGLSYADDRWEVRKAVKVRMTPKNKDHPYHHKDIYIDKQSMKALYSFAYDQKEELWKIIWHNGRWSEDDPSTTRLKVAKARDLKGVSDTIVNVRPVPATGSSSGTTTEHRLPTRARPGATSTSDASRWVADPGTTGWLEPGRCKRAAPRFSCSFDEHVDCHAQRPARVSDPGISRLEECVHALVPPCPRRRAAARGRVSVLSRCVPRRSTDLEVGRCGHRHLRRPLRGVAGRCEHDRCRRVLRHDLSLDRRRRDVGEGADGHASLRLRHLDGECAGRLGRRSERPRPAHDRWRRELAVAAEREGTASRTALRRVRNRRQHGVGRRRVGLAHLHGRRRSHLAGFFAAHQRRASAVRLACAARPGARALRPEGVRGRQPE